MNKFLFAFVAFSIVPHKMGAQEGERKTVKGKISAYANSLQHILVINKQTEKDTQTGENGYFDLAVKSGDTLIFSSTQFKAHQLVIAPEDLQTDLLLVKLEPIMNPLDEVKVFQYKNIDAVSLGIIPKGQRTYTPAERKFKTATGYDAQFGLDTKVTLDPVFNLFSGRTAELRKNIEVEKKEFLLAKIENQFDEEYFIEKLHIPKEHVKGFQFYLVENASFVTALNVKNRTMAMFRMSELSVQYLEILANEKK